jgi:hypothetical protein
MAQFITLNNSSSVNIDEVRGITVERLGFYVGPIFVKPSGKLDHAVIIYLKNSGIPATKIRLTEAAAHKVHQALVTAIDSGKSFAVGDVVESVRETDDSLESTGNRMNEVSV